jgi:hypothetical protein
VRSDDGHRGGDRAGEQRHVQWAEDGVGVDGDGELVRDADVHGSAAQEEGAFVAEHSEPRPPDGCGRHLPERHPQADLAAVCVRLLCEAPLAQLLLSQDHRLGLRVDCQLPRSQPRPLPHLLQAAPLPLGYVALFPSSCRKGMHLVRIIGLIWLLLCSCRRDYYS